MPMPDSDINAFILVLMSGKEFCLEFGMEVQIELAWTGSHGFISSFFMLVEPTSRAVVDIRQLIIGRRRHDFELQPGQVLFIALLLLDGQLDLVLVHALLRQS